MTFNVSFGPILVALGALVGNGMLESQGTGDLQRVLLLCLVQ